MALAIDRLHTSIGKIVLGRDHFSESEEYTALTFQSALGTIAKLESVIDPQGGMQQLRVVVGVKNRKLDTGEVEVSTEASRLEIYQTIRERS